VSIGAAVAVTLLAMAAVNAGMRVGPRWAGPVAGPVAAAGLLLAGRASGLTWGELGLGGDGGFRYAGVAAGLVAVAYAIGVLIPATRRAFHDTRYRLTARAALYAAFVAVPLATVIFEEVAFRGVLWGLIAHERGAAWATGVTSVLFGLWHVLPGRDLAAAGVGRRSAVRTMLGAVVFTTLAGLVLGALRQVSGGLLAPIGLHWAANGLGVLAAAAAWAIGPRCGPG